MRNLFNLPSRWIKFRAYKSEPSSTLQIISKFQTTTQKRSWYSKPFEIFVSLILIHRITMLKELNSEHDCRVTHNKVGRIYLQQKYVSAWVNLAGLQSKRIGSQITVVANSIWTSRNLNKAMLIKWILIIAANFTLKNYLTITSM